MADHKYIKREGTPGNYKYIYDVKDAFGGFGKGVAKTSNSGVKAANTFGKNVASGTAQDFNTVKKNVRKDVKNVGSKLVMGANGAVDKVKDATGNTGKNLGNDIKKASNKVTSVLSKFFGGSQKKNEVAPKVEPKKRAAETCKATVKYIENDKATITGADYLKKAADKGLTKGDDLYDQFSESGDLKITGDKDKVKKLDNYFTRSITEASLVKKATALRKDADDAYTKMGKLNDEFDKKSSELESKGAPMTKLDLRVYAKDKRFKDMIRLESDGETVTDEQIMAGLSEDPYVSVPTEMVKDFENLFEEGYKTAEKEHAARRAEYMANIMDIQNEKNYQKDMKDIEEDDFEWYQNGKRLTGDGELSTSHRVK